MDRECERAMRFTIPAVRIAVSESLKNEHGMSETEIARALGIAQAAVSKYLNKNYSPKLARIVKEIKSRKLHSGLVKAILDGNGRDEILGSIDRIASEKGVVGMAMDS